MNYRRLGDGDLFVSEISLGSWLTFGTAVDADRGRACVRAALDLGIDLFDTANVYGRETAEEELFALGRETGIGNIVWWRTDDLLAAVQRLVPVAETTGLSMAQLALAWVLREPVVSSAIVGATRSEQAAENAAASGVVLDGDLLTAVDQALEGVIA